MKINPMVIILTMLAGWVNQQQQEAINYLKEENKILRDELLKATDIQNRRIYFHHHNFRL